MLIGDPVGEFYFVQVAVYDSTQVPTTKVVRPFSCRKSALPRFKPSSALLIHNCCGIPCVSLQTEIKKHLMKAALARGVETGALIQVKASYKVSAEEKKAAASKAAKAKKETAKKEEPKKKKVRQIVYLELSCRLVSQCMRWMR